MSMKAQDSVIKLTDRVLALKAEYNRATALSVHYMRDMIHFVRNAYVQCILELNELNDGFSYRLVQHVNNACLGVNMHDIDLLQYALGRLSMVPAYQEKPMSEWVNQALTGYVD